MSSRRAALLLIAVILSVAGAGAVDFSSFALRNLTLLGDSFIRDGAVGLTRELGVPASSAGTVFCSFPVKLLTSFSTRFSFAVENLNPGSAGDGLAFFLSPSNATLGSPGAYLGLFNSTDPAVSKNIIAIEFDTKSDYQFGDPSFDHVGLDLGSPASIKTADPELQGVSLRSGNVINSWIEYNDTENFLQVWTSYSNVMPEKPILAVKSDAISLLIKEFMYVGFSASTDGSTERHKILDWSFHSHGVEMAKPKSLRPSYNVSDNSVITPFFHGFNQTVLGDRYSKKMRVWLGVAGPIVLIALGAMIAFYTADQWKTTKIGADVLKGPKNFTYKELKAATKGFHSSRIVGHGAFGKVYKAVFAESGLTFAIKRCKNTTQEGKEEFLSELTAIAGLRHKNLIQLQGWCAEKGELILVYELMENGSLDKALHGEDAAPLSWSERYSIATGIASSLAYLHQECEQQVIHRDIKTSNILLDANYSPKLGDFGLAKIMDHGKSPVSTLTAGTIGYLAPEYLQYGKATEKTDVFSFGVVLLELACGRRPIFKGGDGKKMLNLVDWVWELYGEDRLIEAADPRLNCEFKVDEMIRLLLLGLSCANPDFSLRPSMRKALQMLGEGGELPALPRKKPILTFTPDLPVMLQEIVADCQEPISTSPLVGIKIQLPKDYAEGFSSKIQKGHSEGLFMGESVGHIKVLVVQGKKLVIRDFKSSDPYVVLRLGNQVAKTKVINSCLNPVWNEEFVFAVPPDFGVLKLEVFDKDRFKADDKMGNAFINIQPIASAARLRKVLHVSDASDAETNIRKVVPDTDNCLGKDSFVRCLNGEIVQDMWLRLGNVESGELELKIKWVDAPPASHSAIPKKP